MGGRSDTCGYGTGFEARRWLSLDPCGIMGITLSWSVHIYALVIIPTYLLSDALFATAIYYALYIPVAAMALLSLFMASTTDPGAVPLGARPLTTVRRAGSTAERRGVRRCHKCLDNYKPPRAHHDSITGRCIVKFDHFCPWVNNAVGALNHKFFCQFLFYTAISCLLSLFILFLRVIHCGFVHDDEKDVDAEDMHEKPAEGESGQRILETRYVFEDCNNFYGNHLVMLLLVVSLVFLVFTVSMGCEQMEAISTGKGKIARMKMSVGQGGTEYATVTEEFNEMFGGDSPHPALHWFLPKAVQFPRGMKKVVLGYDYDETTMGSTPYQEDDSSSGSAQELEDLEGGRPTAVATLVADAPAMPSRTGLAARTLSDVSVSSENGVRNRQGNSRTPEPELV